MPRLTKFSTDWLEKKDRNGDLIKNWCCGTKNEYEAKCIPCNYILKIGNQGFSQITSHAGSVKHKKAVSGLHNQTVLTPSSSSTIGKTNLVLKSANGFTSFCLADKILKAEVYLVLAAIKNNYSFSSLTNLSQLYREVFDDSDVAKGIKLSDKKVRYVVNFGLAPFFKTEILKDIGESFFAIHFDETTTKQAKKQMDICLSYWSETQGKVIYTYCDSYFLGHADAKTLLGKLLNFLDDNNLKIEKLIQLSMDGPNTNLSVQKKLDATLNDKSLPPLLSIGTCYLHILHNSFRKGLSKLFEELDVDRFAVDIHQWFKLSPAKKEDFHCLQEQMLDDVLANHVFIRHVSTRWLTIGPVCDRIIEQFEVLKKYFLKECGGQESNSERYVRIVAFLKKPSTILYLNFISYLASLFKPYMLLLQKETPIIHLLYPKLNEFVRSILSKFLKTAVVGEKKGTHLIEMLPDDAKNWLEAKKIIVGQKTRDAMNEVDKSFFLCARSVYITISKYLLTKLPISHPFLNDVQCLCPLNRKKPNAKLSVCRLPQYLPQISKIGIMMSDRVGEEWLIYMCDEEVTSLTDKYNVGFDISKYWSEISKLKDCTGVLKYTHLSKVAKACLTVSPANSQPERGFSVNNNIVTNERSSLSELCIKSLRICKDVIRQHDSISDIKITKQLMASVRKSHAEYSAYLEQEKTKVENLKKKRAAEDEARNSAKKLKLSNLAALKDLKIEEKRLLSDQNAAQKLLNEANTKLTKAINDSDMSEIKMAQMMLSAANNSMQSINTKLADCSSKQGKLKVQD